MTNEGLWFHNLSFLYWLFYEKYKDMDINNLKCIVGKAEANKPALIRLFGAIDTYTCENFVDEFNWLHDCVKPSKIVVLINSEGGSVIRGMSVYSTIQSSEIEVECINEGLAASMASVIWAAGNKSLMRDYAILMIHNPYSAVAGDDNDNNSDVIESFKNQLRTIYCRRFNLSKEKVEEIMDGKEGADGTYMTANDAVKAGIIDKSCIIKTSKQTRDKVNNSINNSEISAINVRQMMDSIVAEIDENKLSEITDAIHEQKTQNKSKMNENEFTAIVALLGLNKDAQSNEISAKVTELMGVKAELTKLKANFDEQAKAFSELQIVNQGNEAKVSNLTKQLEDVNASLKSYQDKEQAEKAAEIEAMVDSAIADGKIAEESKDQWINMAGQNVEMVRNTLNSIPKRDVISREIGSDPENRHDAHEGQRTAEEKMQAKVSEVVGENFEFKKID